MNVLDLLRPRRRHASGQVLAAWMVAPNIRRIRLGGIEVERFIEAAEMETPASWVKVELADGQRRAYTIRSFDPWAGTLDLEFVIHQAHGSSGPASNWASNAKAGDWLAIAGPRHGGFQMPLDTTWLVLAGDATALPAIHSIVRHLPEHMVADVFVELADTAGQLELISAATLHVHQIQQGPIPGDALSGALKSHELRGSPGYVWAACEAGGVRAIRNLYLQERGMEPRRLSAKGYWKLGTAAHKDRDS